MNTSAIKAALYGWLSKMGSPTIIKLAFDADFVDGNVINAKINAVDARETTWQGSHEATMAKLADNLMRHASVFKAPETGVREIRAYGLDGQPLTFTSGPTVTGGTSQAVCTKTTLQTYQAVPAIFADQAAPRPKPPFLTVRLLSVVPVGQDEIREIDPDTNIATIGGQRRLAVSVNAYGSGATDYLAQALASLNKVTVQEYLRAAGLAVCRIGTSQNLTAMLETEYEERVQADVTFNLAENVEDDLGIIEKVEYEGDLTNGSTIHVGPTIIP